MGLLRKTCSTNPQAQAPNPRNWKLLRRINYVNAYIMVVQYPGCTNFEGIKIMVFEGKYEPRCCLDPHFSDDDKSPIARFKPDGRGLALAIVLAKNL
jgi:hypothetical protein